TLDWIGGPLVSDVGQQGGQEQVEPILLHQELRVNRLQTGQEEGGHVARVGRVQRRELLRGEGNGLAEQDAVRRGRRRTRSGAVAGALELRDRRVDVRRADAAGRVAVRVLGEHHRGRARRRGGVEARRD